MAVLISVLLFLHLLGMAVLVASFLLQRRVAPAGPLYVGWLHGAWLQVVTGLAMVGIAEFGPEPLNYPKITVKLVVGLAILVLALVFRRREPLPGWVAPTLGGLTLLNVAVAVFWL
jgi:hypothetical protein